MPLFDIHTMSLNPYCPYRQEQHPKVHTVSIHGQCSSVHIVPTCTYRDNVPRPILSLHTGKMSLSQYCPYIQEQCSLVNIVPIYRDNVPQSILSLYTWTMSLGQCCPYIQGQCPSVSIVPINRNNGPQSILSLHIWTISLNLHRPIVPI